MPSVLTRLSGWTNARRKCVWLLLFVLIIATVAIVLTPVFLIMPFKAQTPRILEVSYVLRRWSPLLTPWNFESKAIGGPLAGRQLKKIFVLEDYWFDWRLYHPDTGIYDIGPG